MKVFQSLFVVFAALGLIVPASAQVTNLTLNGVSSNFTMTSGDTVKWEYNIPTGASVLGELWYDINGNGTIEPGTDEARFLFYQTDGVANENGGPPDLDGAVNGHILFYEAVGLSPGKYVLRFTFNAQSASIAGTISPLASPAHTISGTVTPPAGKSAQYINVVLHRSGQFGDPNFWDAYTDAGGNYSINMNADTAGNPWDVRIEDNPYPPASISPQDTPVVITGNHSGYNFLMLAAAAQVDGSLKDEAGNPFSNNDVTLSRDDGGVYLNGRPGFTGLFAIGLTTGDLTGHTWHLQSNNNNGGVTGSQLIAQARLPVIHQGDSLFYPLVVYTANAHINGLININGSPANFQIQVEASNEDSAAAETWSDSASGGFDLQVTDKIHTYSVFPVNLPPNYVYTPATAHAGDIVILNITATSVRERGAGIPGAFALHQNYPNPFNPATTIDYDIPTASHVRLTVFNILGEEVAQVVNADQNAGTYRATIDASRLSSGVYLYRMTAVGSSTLRPEAYTLTKKMLLIR